MRNRLQPWPVLLAIAISGTSARAATVGTAPSVDSTAEARERFHRGVLLYREGNLDAALAEFRLAYETSPNYRVLFNMGQVQVERRDAVAAIKLFTEYLERGGSDVDPDRRAQVERDIQMLRTRVSQLTVTTQVVGPQLSIDGVDAGSLPLREPLWVNAGIHQILVQKAGYRSASRTITIAGAEPLQINLTLDAERVALANSGGSAPVEPTRPGSRHSLGTAFWSSLLVTGVLGGTAVTFGLLTIRANAKLDDELNTFPTNAANLAGARSQLKTTALLTDAFAGAAAVAAGVTVYFAATGSPGEPTDLSSKSASRQSRSVTMSLSGPNLIVTGTF